mgnify:CR=1 FL=1
MNRNIGSQIIEYFASNMGNYLSSVREHIVISILALLFAIVIGVPCGYLSIKYKKHERWIITAFQVLRVVPSMAVIILLIPIMGTGTR